MKCKGIHESTKRRGLGCTFAFILPVALGYVLQEIFRTGAGIGSPTISGFMIAGIVCGVILSIIIGKRFYDFLRANETKSENQKMQYPPVKEMIEKGYKIIP